MGIRPLQDRVLVEPNTEAESKTAAGIIIPDSAKEKPMEGTIKAAGNGKLDNDGKRVALEVKVGDKVLYGKYAGTEVKVDGKEYLLMREDDILGIIE
ncbi:MAG: co-chaperone GroES [Nitrospinae bacterium]|nr:co-chaperone GroES [Nitrospinota bacterium]